MTPTDGVSAPGWRIEGQQVGLEQGPGGNYVKGVSVYFVTAVGNRGSVFLTDSEYTAGNVEDVIRDRVSAKAAQADRISALTG